MSSPRHASAASAGLPRSCASLDDPRVEQAMEEYLRLLQLGVRPDRGAFVAQYPEVAAVLAECLQGLDFVHAAGPDLSQPRGHGGLFSVAEVGAAVELGDFRVIREVGRGGMGVVYEAVQLSLSRRVALKVLSPAATFDPKQLRRFELEAQAAAQLHHTNIVPIHFVGSERGVHFYAMQFIAGRNLAVVIEELRRQQQPESGGQGTRLPGSEARPASPCADSTSPVAGLSTEPSIRGTDYLRSVARLGIQCAEALAHAHAMGVVHRDIKPANLLLDGRGQLWVTDFGLARLQNDAGLTATGDLLGTLRYMSPEQALAKPDVVDERTDVYSLGATLYELLTLQPPFTGGDRQELLRQIAGEEPLPPRRLNKSIPTELETVALKAVAKNPAERYATAQALADDLRRFLDDKPIHARRPSVWQLARKWVWRHRAAAAMVAWTVLALAGLGAAGLWIAGVAAERALESKGRDYSVAMLRAQRAWEMRDYAMLAELLDRQRPAPGERDVRGFEWFYLWGLYREEGLQLVGPKSAAWGLAYSPDGQTLAVGSRGGALQLWNTTTRRLALSLEGHKGPIHELAFARDGKALLTCSGGNENRVCLWDLSTGHVQASWPGGQNPACAPDGGAFAVFGENRLLSVHDLPDGSERVRFTGQAAKDTRAIAFAPDQEHLTSAAPDGYIHVWKRSTGEQVRQLKAPAWPVGAQTFSSDGRWFAAGGADGSVLLWDATTWQPRSTLPGPARKISRLAFSPDVKSLAVLGEEAAGNHVVRLWDIAALPSAPASPAGSVTVQSPAARVWAQLESKTGTLTSLAFAPDGSTLAVGAADGIVRFWRPRRTQDRLRPIGHAPNEAWRLAFSPDGKTVVSGGDDRHHKETLKCWDVATGKSLWTSERHNSMVSCLAYCPDGKLIASGDFDGNIKLWDPAGKELAAFVGHSRPLWSMAFSPDSRLMATGARDGMVHIWDVATRQRVRTLGVHDVHINGVTFTPDSRGLVTSSEDCVFVWDVASGAQLREFKDSADVHCVAISPDGSFLAVGNKAGHISLWDPATGKGLGKLAGHTAELRAVAFSPDSRTLASASLDQTIRLWDPHTGIERLTLRGHQAAIHAVAFSPAGDCLASASHDGEIKLWRAPRE